MIKKILIGLGALVVIGAIIGGTQKNDDPRPSYDSPAAVVQDTSSDTASSGQSSGESNAISKARDYLSTQAFSRKGLIGQLEYEGFTHVEAVYGADNAGANWSEQAALKAKEYLSNQSFSRSGLIEQLEYEGFSPSQASYGVSVAY